MDDLETNPLFKAFLGKFRREFDIACKMSYVIAIPHSDNFDDLTVDQFLVNSHILMPSKLLKMHYTPLHTGFASDVEELDDGNKLLVSLANKKSPANKLIVHIVDQEVGYNVNNREFRTILIDRPLADLEHLRSRSPLLLRSIFSSSPAQRKMSNGKLSRHERNATKPQKPLTNHDNCLKYLEYISQEVTVELENEVKKLQARYMILSAYLKDAAQRIKTLAEAFVPRFEAELSINMMSRNGSSSSIFSLNDNSDIDIICDSLRNSISLAVESYIVHLLHGKLIASLYQQYEKQDRILMKKFDLIQKQRLTICQLGAQSAFSHFHLNDEIKQEFRSLSSLQSPISVVNSLMKAVQLITEALNQSVRFKDQFGSYDLDLDPTFAAIYRTKVTICSDDLIATFVYCLANSKPTYLYSTSKYLETFGFSSNAKEQAAYYTATFQIVIQYIFNFRPSIQDTQATLTTTTVDETTSSNEHATQKHHNHKLFAGSKDSKLETNSTDDDDDDDGLSGFHQQQANYSHIDDSNLNQLPHSKSNHKCHQLFDSLESRESISTADD